MKEKKIIQMVTDGCISFNTAEKYFPDIAEEKDLKFICELIEFLEEIHYRGANANFDKWSKSQVSEWINWLYMLKKSRISE